MEFLNRLSSRKFLAGIALSVALFVVGFQDGELTEAEARNAMAPVIAFILAEGAADTAARFKS